MKKVINLQAPQQQATEAEQLYKKFPNTFDALRRGTTYMLVDHLWADMKLAGITEANLPEMEAAITAPGHKFFQQFASYWG